MPPTDPPRPHIQIRPGFFPDVLRFSIENAWNVPWFPQFPKRFLKGSNISDALVSEPLEMRLACLSKNVAGLFRTVRFPIEKSRKSGKMRDMGSGGSGGHFCCKYYWKNSPKARRVILLHFALVTFGIHFRTTRKHLICMVFGPSGRDTWLQKPIIFDFGDTKNKLRKIQAKYQIIFQTHCFGKSQNVGNRHLGNCWKRRWPKQTEDPSNIFANGYLAIWESIFSRKHEMANW